MERAQGVVRREGRPCSARRARRVARTSGEFRAGAYTKTLHPPAGSLRFAFACPERWLAAFLRESRLPALRVLAIGSGMLAAPVDFSPLGMEVVVHVEYAPDDDLGTIRHAASARTLALALGRTHTPEALVAVLESRREGDTWVSTVWEHADAAVELARLRGVRLQAR